MSGHQTETRAQPSGVTRRGLFRMLVGECTQGNRAAEDIIPETPLPRPPWARDNRSFLALCDRCTLCQGACPERILKAVVSDNEALDGVPLLNLGYGECGFCGQCVDVCPTGALDREHGEKLQAIAVVNGSCSRALGMHCDICADSCPEQAIILTDKTGPVIDLQTCTGCGNCALHCYSRVFEIKKR